MLIQRIRWRNEQNTRLTETNRRQDMVIASLHDEVFELKNLVKTCNQGTIAAVLVTERLGELGHSSWTFPGSPTKT